MSIKSKPILRLSQALHLGLMRLIHIQIEYLVLIELLLLVVLSILVMVLGFLGWLHLPVFVLLLLPLLGLAAIGVQSVLSWLVSSRKVKILGLGLAVVWLSHLLQVFVLETGFDALWYHLPLIDHFVMTGKFEVIPSVVQSMYPFFSDTVFVLWYQLWAVGGAKLGAYCTGLLLACIVYVWSKPVLSKPWRLVLLFFVSLMQVVTWQVASVYVDLIVAVWILGSVWLLSVWYSVGVQLSGKRTLWLLLLAGMMGGAAVASKEFLLLAIPLLLLVVWVSAPRQPRRQTLRSLMVYFIGLLITALPMYVYSFLVTQQLLFATQTHIANLAEIGGQQTAAMYVLARLSTLPLSPLRLVLSRDYVSPLSIFFVPLLLLFALRFKKIPLTLKTATIIGSGGWLLWWFVPPLSTRYAVFGFIALLLLLVFVLQKVYVRYARLRSPLVIGIAVVLVLLFVPRLFVNARSIRFLIGLQTPAEYLDQFRDENNSDKITQWYGY